MNASHGDSGCDCQTTMFVQPNRCGNRTVWPRLEMGNSSLTPCSRPRTIAWKVEIFAEASARSTRASLPATVGTSFEQVVKPGDCDGGDPGRTASLRRRPSPGGTSPGPAVAAWARGSTSARASADRRVDRHGHEQQREV